MLPRDQITKQTSLLGAPGLAPGLSAPTGYPSQIPPNFNFNAPVIHFGQSLSGATIISTPDPSTIQPAPVVRPTYIKEPEGPRLAPSAEDQLHTVFVGNIPDDISDEWLDRIARVCLILQRFPDSVVAWSIKGMAQSC